MKAIFKRQELLPLIRAAESIAPHDSPLDVLRGVLLDADDCGRVTIMATNIETSLEQQTKADVEESGRILLPARLFLRMLSCMEGELVGITGKDGKSACISSGDAVYTIPVLSSKDFPNMAQPFPEDTVTVRGIPAITKRTTFAIAYDDTKPLLRCVNLIFANNALTAVSCDGVCLASAKGDSKGTASVSMLVPAKPLEKLSHLVSNKDELKVGTTGKSIVFSKEGFSFSTRLMAGQAVDGVALLNSVKSSFTILTDGETLYDAMSSSLSVNGEVNCFSLRFADSKVYLRCESEYGIATREVDVVPLSGMPEGEFWYSPHQLLQCLRALRGTLMLDVGQGGMLLMRTDDLTCLQTARRKPTMTAVPKKTAKKATTKAKSADAPKAA